MTTLDEPTFRLVRKVARWYARRSIRSAAIDADDLFQDACLAVVLAARKRGGKLSRELASAVARRACVDAFRRALGGDAGAAAAIEAAATAPASGPAATAEESLDLAEALDGIRPEDAEVLRLRFVESATFDEIAVRLGISRHLAFDRSARGLGELREKLGPAYADQWARAVPLRRPDDYKARARRIRTARPPRRTPSKGPPGECARVAARKLATIERARQLVSRP